MPHITDARDVEFLTPNLLKSSGCILTIQDTEINLAKFPITFVDYIDGTGIIRIDYKAKKLEVHSYIWSPMTIKNKVAIFLYHIIDGSAWNLRPSDVKPGFEGLTPQFEKIAMMQMDGKGFWVGLAVIYIPGILQETLQQLEKELSNAKPKLLLEAEQRWWQHWHSSGSIPSSVYGSRYKTLLQSLAFIKMAQCQEPGPGRGQIVKNLSPEFDSAAMTRDMAFSILALCRTGHFAEAKAALSFLLTAQAGIFRSNQYSIKKWGSKSPYLISLASYTGMGFEKAEIQNNSPIIYFDSFGLFLWAMTEYVKHSSDLDFASNHWPNIQKFIITPMLDAIDETGLIKQDSGWLNTPMPGEHFCYTSLSAFKGLNSAAVLAYSIHQDERAILYTKKAAELRTAILTKLTVGKSILLSRSLEVKQYPNFLDGSTVDAINWEIVSPYWKTASSISKALDVFLRPGNAPRGFVQYYKNDNQLYHENPFVTLRAVSALYTMQEEERADQILEYMTHITMKNAGMIPSFLTVENMYFIEPYPVIGTGAAAMILAILKSVQK
ncbi:hypothetical protein JW935_09485 [candidate division KSB1 bacterium]|nr:hypothetical protein [candidate division KSB1 bacterium]